MYKVFGKWKGYYRVKKSLVSYMKPWTEARNNEYMKYHSKLTYQLSFWNVSRKVDYHAGGKWFSSSMAPNAARRYQWIRNKCHFGLWGAKVISPLGQNGPDFANIFSDAFSWTKNFVYWLKCHWSLFLRVQLTITQYWFRSCFGVE